VNCLITDHVHPYLLDSLQKANVKTTYLPNITQQEVEKVIGDYNILIVNSKIKINETFVKNCHNLKIVGRLGSGMDGIDIDALEKADIHVVRTPEGNANAVSEHAIGMLLSLSNHLRTADSEVRNFDWNREKNRGWEISNKVLGIIGFGHTGSQLADKMSGWVQEVVCYDNKVVGYNKQNPLVVEGTLDEVKQKADIISIHLPLDEETEGMINKKFLQECKPGFVLINTSRGKIVDTEDLLDGLQRGYVGGACLDVFENEKVETYSEVEKETYQALYDLPNVVLTPHIAGWTFESYFKIGKVMAEKILALI